MSREQILNDIPQIWRDNLRVGHCWCGKPRSEFDKNQKIYCSTKHADEISSRVQYWSSFKDIFLRKHGKTCIKCGMTAEKFEKLEQTTEEQFYKDLAIEHKEAIEFERTKMLNELEEKRKMIFDDGYVMQHLGYKTKEAFSIDLDYDNRYHKEFFNIEVDHIKAISLGGEMWDEKNLQPLCNFCHKIKTKEDMQKLKILKKQKKNEVLI